MSRKFKVPLSEQYGKDRDGYYPVREASDINKKIDYFDPDEE